MADATSKLTGLSRFQLLWQRNLIAGAADDSSAIHQRLLDAYGESHRHYHTLAHIEHCLVMFDQCSRLVEHPDRLEIAIWFHDVILVCGKRDNEARSAQLYLELSAGVHDDDMRDNIHGLIMATVHDGGSLDFTDASYMVDIDLSSFGLPWDEFLQDSQDLRAESSHLCDADYHLNQTGFQRGLLARPQFYLSEFFHSRYEQQARANLARYFDYLENPA